MTKFDEIAIQRLVLDQDNPRLRRTLPQDELIAGFASSKKTRALAKHISKYGMSPLEAVAVVAIDKTRKFTVREGNRRVAAIKLLHDPSLAGTEADEKYYGNLAKLPDAILPERIFCAIMDDEAEVRRWIRLKHVSDQSGVGTLFWEPWQKANFDDGTGGAGKYRHAREAVNAAMEKEWIGEKEHEKLNLSTLSRIFDDEAARQELGFLVGPSGLTTQWPISDQEKVIKKIIVDTGRGGSQTSRTLRTTENMVAYAKAVKKTLKIKLDLGAPTHRIGSSAVVKQAVSPRPKTKMLPDDLKRKHVVPRTFKVPISEARALEICEEMRDLDVVDSPNAVALLFRVFLEFSVQHYVELHAIPKKDRDTLADVLRRVSEHLLASDAIKKGELTAVNKGLNDPNHFLSVTQLNMYVHNKLIHPTQRELNATWNGSEALFRALWADGGEV